MTRAHRVSFLVLLAVFTGLTWLITYAGVDDGPERAARIAWTTLATITGPLTGAISRGFSQGCCLAFSLRLMAWCGPVLLVGIAAQFLARPERRRARRVCLALWIAGWLTWFLGGLVSFGHALS